MILAPEELEQYVEIKNQTTNNDGTFNIGVSPGKYDLLIDKPGYLYYVIKNITITDKGKIDLGDITIIAGDINKDGMIDLMDMTTLNDNYGAVEGASENYNLNIDYTEDGIVDLTDMTIINNNYGQLKTVINYEEGGV